MICHCSIDMRRCPAFINLSALGASLILSARSQISPSTWIAALNASLSSHACCPCTRINSAISSSRVGKLFFFLPASSVTVGGFSLSTFASNSSSGMLATRMAVFAWSADMPASSAADLRVTLGGAPPLMFWFAPRAGSISLSNSPPLRIARDWIREAILNRLSSLACLA